MTASMSGGVFFAVVVGVALVGLSALVSPFFLIPAVFVVLVALFAGPALAGIARFGARGRSSQLPTTAEASYEPVAQPEERPFT